MGPYNMYELIVWVPITCISEAAYQTYCAFFDKSTKIGTHGD